jgi:drug/metabolite transporter (DMT)-like permease
LALFRWLGVSILVLPILIKSYQKIWYSLKKNFFILSLLSILGITLFNTILYVGLQDTEATNALLINSFVPILILIFSYFILKIKIGFKQFIGILISTLGVIFLILKGNVSTLFTLTLNYGDIWILTSSMTWALYSVIVKFRPKDLNDFEFFTTIVYLGLFWLSLAYIVMGYSLQEDMTLIKTYYLAFLYVAIFPSVLSYYFWHQGIHKIGANKTGQFTHLMPLFGSILAYIFLGEKLYFYHIMGAILIGSGIYLSLFTKKETS